MKPSDSPPASEAVRCDDLFASVASLWESRPECLERVTGQVRAIHGQLINWGWGAVDRDELYHATIAYSRVCVECECCEWLPFDVMPNWEDGLYCVLMDEDFWREKRAENIMGYEIAEMLRAREANGKITQPTNDTR